MINYYRINHQAPGSMSVKFIWKSTLFGPHIPICSWVGWKTGRRGMGVGEWEWEWGMEVGEWEWGMGSEYQLFFLGHPVTFFRTE